MSDIRFAKNIERECPLHGRWVFPPEAIDAVRRFEFDHREHAWPTSNRPFPPKSRKRVPA